MKARKAQPEDIGTLIELLLLMREESPVYRPFTPEFGKAYKTLLTFILNPDVLVLILDDASGMFIGKVEPSLWFEESVAWEEILFVKKELRGNGGAQDMVEVFEHWAKERGVAETCLVLNTEVTFEKTFNFYERLGYKPSGAIFHKEVV